MYRVLLIDDEPWALDGIFNAFQWEEAGFRVIGKFTDSIEALEHIFSELPDVVFTDIRMPELSGLDLVRKVQQSGIHTEFIMVSGFADFTFAREALRLGALDYIVKPIDSEEVESILKKILFLLEEKNISKDLEMFESLLDNQMNAADLISAKDFKCTKDPAMVVILKNAPEDFVRQVLPETLNKTVLKLGGGKFLYILNESEEVLEEIRRKFTRINDCSRFTAGISSINESIEFVPKMIREADIAAYNGSFCFRSSVSVYQNANYKTIKRYLEKICFLINSHQYEAFKKQIMELPEGIAHEKMGLEEAVFLWNQLVSFCTNVFGRDLKDCDVYYMEYYQVANRFYNIHTFVAFINGIFDEILTGNDSTMINTAINEKFVQILDYIHENYNENLQLSTLADKFYFNFSYFSSSFKKVTGKSFTDYLTDIRIKKACSYLEFTSAGVNEICMNVGYNDYFYFNKVFKKKIGITPAQYRISKR